MRSKLIENGMRNLKEFGYVGVDETNIMTDMNKILKEEKARGGNKVCDELINEIQSR